MRNGIPSVAEPQYTSTASTLPCYESSLYFAKPATLCLVDNGNERRINHVYV